MAGLSYWWNCLEMHHEVLEGKILLSVSDVYNSYLLGNLGDWTNVMFCSMNHVYLEDFTPFHHL